MLGYVLRVTMPTPGENNSYYFIPDQNPFIPRITFKTNGLPAYGQVFLAEALGGCILVLVVLNIKFTISKNPTDVYWYPIGYTVA